jgi:hypothetical protein
MRREAVRELAEIWKRITGNKPTRRVHKGDHATKAGRPYGPFFEFVSLALRPIFGVEPETGIDADIRRVCASMEKSPW